jgi:hypothetical protein
MCNKKKAKKVEEKCCIEIIHLNFSSFVPSYSVFLPDHRYLQIQFSSPTIILLLSLMILLCDTAMLQLSLQMKRVDTSYFTIVLFSHLVLRSLRTNYVCFACLSSPICSYSIQRLIDSIVLHPSLISSLRFPYYFCIKFLFCGSSLCSDMLVQF